VTEAGAPGDRYTDW